MIAIKPISRFRAAAIHLALSAIIAAATLAIMLALWYPPPLFGAMGGTELVILIVGVDVAIGPLITLIIFDTRKKELVYDLAVVAALQLCALTYGIYAMHAGRPVFMAFVENRFAIIAAADLEPEALTQAARPEFRALSLTGPRLVGVNLPTDSGERQLMMLASAGGVGPQHQPKYYAPYDDLKRQALAQSYSLDMLSNLTTEEKAELDTRLTRLGRQKASLRFLPVVASRAILTALIDAQTGDVVETLAVNPARR